MTIYFLFLRTYSLFILVNFYFFSVLGLHCCVRAFSSWGAEPLVAVASLVVEHRLYSTRASEMVGHGLQLCGTQAQLPYSMWGLPDKGSNWFSPALQGRFLTTGPPGKPWLHIFYFILCQFGFVVFFKKVCVWSNLLNFLAKVVHHSSLLSF